MASTEDLRAAVESVAATDKAFQPQTQLKSEQPAQRGDGGDGTGHDGHETEAEASQSKQKSRITSSSPSSTSEEGETSSSDPSPSASPEPSQPSDPEKSDKIASSEQGGADSSHSRPLPTEPTPNEEPQDDGWDFQWDPTSQSYFFYNRFTGRTTWENPRVANGSAAAAPGVDTPAERSTAEGAATTTAAAAPPPPPLPTAAGGYNPAIHGDYDPNAWYAQPRAAAGSLSSTTTTTEPYPAGHEALLQQADPSLLYVAGAGRFSNNEGHLHADEARSLSSSSSSRRQANTNAFFDVDAAANSHDGRSLKAERSGKRLTKGELKAFKEKRKAKKEEKRRAWLRD